MRPCALPGVILLDGSHSSRSSSARSGSVHRGDARRGASSESSDSIYTPPAEDDLHAGSRDRALRHDERAGDAGAVAASKSTRLANSRRDTAQLVASSTRSTSHTTAHSSRASHSVRERAPGSRHNDKSPRSSTSSRRAPGRAHHAHSASSTTSDSDEHGARNKQGPHHNREPGAVAASASSESYDYYTSDMSRSNSMFSDFSGRSNYGSSLARRQEAAAFAPLNLAELGGRESQDHRSSLVTTADLEVAVVKHLLSRESTKSYLLARLEGLRQYVRMLAAQQRQLHQGPLERVADAQNRTSRRTDAGTAARMVGVTRGSWLSPDAYSSTELASIERQTNAVWQLHIDAVVERYLSDPIYNTALKQFRKHQSAAHQYLRLPDYQENFHLATSLTEQFRLSKTVVRVLQGDGSAATAGGSWFDCTANTDDLPQHALEPQQQDPTTVSGITGQPVYQRRAGLATTATSRFPPSSYGLQRSDVELLGMDAARRIRFKDDTLPWRPVNFASTSVRLEPIDSTVKEGSQSAHGYGQEGSAGERYERHSSSPDHSLADAPGTTQSGPLVGGSINLLVEVLILTESDVPFTSGVPRVNFTNVFMIAASLFVLPDVLISKLVRLFRSVYYWKRYELFSAMGDASSDDSARQRIVQRASYLHRRILQCMLAYCRCHEMDLTVRVLQRISLFIEKCGFPSPLATIDANTHSWTASRGVLDGVTLTRSAGTAAASAAAPATANPTVPGRPSGRGSNSSGGGASPPSKGTTPSRETPVVATTDFRTLALRSSTTVPQASGSPAGATIGDTTRIPMDAFDPSVVNGFVELSIYIYNFTRRHYYPFAVQSSPAAAAAAAASATPVPAPSHLSTTPTAAAQGSPLLARSVSFSGMDGGMPMAPVASPPLGGLPHNASTVSVDTTQRGGGGAGTTMRAASAGVSHTAPHPPSALPYRPLVYLDRGEPRKHVGSTYVAGRQSTNASPLSHPAHGDSAHGSTAGPYGHSVSEYRHGSTEGNGRRVFAYPAVSSLPTPEEFFWVLRGNVAPGTDFGGNVGAAFRKQCLERPGFHPSMINAELFAQQLSVLSFSLFSRIRVRELLNNAWRKVDMRYSVAGHLNELIRYGHKLSLWVAALITTPREWTECQRSVRHFLEICRRLYDQQNYEMASCVLDGLQHDAVARLSILFREAHEEPILTSAEQRELETLTELMNPYAAYSPSSLNSVTARTAGDMDSAIIPLLSPILSVLSRSQQTLSGNPAVMVREHDGQAIIVWTRVVAIGKMVNLWLRCQVTPFPFRPEPALQEYLWSAANHQWTDDALQRVARREKH